MKRGGEGREGKGREGWKKRRREDVGQQTKKPISIFIKLNSIIYHITSYHILIYRIILHHILGRDVGSLFSTAPAITVMLGPISKPPVKRKIAEKRAQKQMVSVSMF